MAQTVKNPPAMWETWVWSLDLKDLLEEGIVAHSSIVAWRIPMDREPGGLLSMGSQRVRHNWAIKYTNTYDPAPIFILSGFIGFKWHKSNSAEVISLSLCICLCFCFTVSLTLFSCFCFSLLCYFRQIFLHVVEIMDAGNTWLLSFHVHCPQSPKQGHIS